MLAFFIILFTPFKTYLKMIVFTLFACSFNLQHCCCITIHALWDALTMEICLDSFHILRSRCSYLPFPFIVSVFSFSNSCDSALFQTQPQSSSLSMSSLLYRPSSFSGSLSLSRSSRILELTNQSGTNFNDHVFSLTALFSHLLQFYSDQEQIPAAL